MCSNSCNNFKISDDCCDDNGNSLETVSIENPITLSIPANPSVWADASGPKPKLLIDFTGDTSAQIFSKLFYDGWYFKNDLGSVGNTPGSKINWIIPPPNSSISPATITNADIQSLAIANLVIEPSSSLFINVYTRRTGTETPDELPSGGSDFYKCRLNYEIKNSSTVLQPYTNYLFKYKFDPSAKDYYMPYGATQVDLEFIPGSSVFKNSNGVDVNLPEDKILYWTISSNSGATSGEVESIVSKFIVQIKDDRVYSCEFNDAAVLAYNIVNPTTLANMTTSESAIKISPEKIF